MPDIESILQLVAAGQYWPAVSLALILATHLVRRGIFDPWLERLRAKAEAEADPDQPAPWGLGHLRAVLPIVLSAVAWTICVLSPFDVDATQAAYTLLVSSLGAMGGYDSVRAVLAAARVRSGRIASSDAQPSQENLP